jgi:hypothetical protein
VPAFVLYGVVRTHSVVRCMQMHVIRPVNHLTPRINCSVVANYSLRPKLMVVLGFRAIILTRFVKNMYNIFISK